jgi:hypothetical protein
MKKGTYINIYVMIASVSHNGKKESRFTDIDELINNACSGCNTECDSNNCKKKELTEAEVYQLFA